MSMTDTSRHHLTLYPHIRLVSGQIGAAVYDFFTPQVLWFRDGSIADALARLVQGESLEEAAEASSVTQTKLLAHVSLITQFRFGALQIHRSAPLTYSPGLLKYQAEKLQLFRPGGLLTLELSDKCTYDCVFCASKTLCTRDACACSVWPRLRDPLPVDRLFNALETLHIAGVERVEIRGGDPFLYPDRLWAVLDAIRHLNTTLQLHIHTTGLEIDESVAERLTAYSVSLSLVIAGHSPDKFDSIVGRKGSFQRVIHTLDLLHEAGIAFKAMVPACVEDPHEACAVADWIMARGAKSVDFLWYAPPSWDPMMLQQMLGPESPDDMRVTLEQFIRNTQAHPCFDNVYFIAFDGGLSPCAGIREPFQSLHDVSMETVLRDKQFQVACGPSRLDVAACRACEFRIACKGCLVRTKQLKGTVNGRYAQCNYSPESASWQTPGYASLPEQLDE